MAFNNWKQRRDWKILQVIQQFYTEERYLAISGSNSKPETRIYDPKKVEGMHFDTVISQGVDSPVYRQIMDEYLVKFFEVGAIDFEMLLENSALPFANQLLDAVRKSKSEMQAGQAGSIPDDLLAQVKGRPNPEAV